MLRTTNKLSLIGLIIAAIILAFSATAAAHVTVKPGEFLTSSFQTFTVGAPNEKK